MAIRQAYCSLKSLTPYSQSGFFVSVKNPKETHQAFEERCWQERIHSNDDGFVIIPNMSLKYAVDEACKRMAIQVPGEGKTRYAKYLEASCYLPEAPVLSVKADDVPGKWLWMHSDGKRGGTGGRVHRCYPEIREWETTAVFALLDEKVPDDIFEQCLQYAGHFVGIGRFRPENQGYYGRFSVEKIDWK